MQVLADAEDSRGELNARWVALQTAITVFEAWLTSW